MVQHDSSTGFVVTWRIKQTSYQNIAKLLIRPDIMIKNMSNIDLDFLNFIYKKKI